jgi:hypothetical protein
MSDMKAGDLVVLFMATIARDIVRDDYVWLDRSRIPHLVVFVSNRCDPDTGAREVGIYLSDAKEKGIYVVPRSALVFN